MEVEVDVEGNKANDVAAAMWADDFFLSWSHVSCPIFVSSEVRRNSNAKKGILCW